VKRLLIAILVILVLLVIVLVAYYYIGVDMSPTSNTLNNTQKQDFVILTETEDTITFKGHIESRRNDCFVDGICSFTVNGLEIITSEGDQGGPGPYIFGTIDQKVEVGSSVEVYAKKRDGNKVTIIGSRDYYIKKLD
jgi:hypothetical protein